MHPDLERILVDIHQFSQWLGKLRANGEEQTIASWAFDKPHDRDIARADALLSEDSGNPEVWQRRLADAWCLGEVHRLLRRLLGDGDCSYARMEIELSKTLGLSVRDLRQMTFQEHVEYLMAAVEKKLLSEPLLSQAGIAHAFHRANQPASKLSRKTVSDWVNRKDFPSPVAQHDGKPAWSRRSVIAWVKANRPEWEPVE